MKKPALKILALILLVGIPLLFFLRDQNEKLTLRKIKNAHFQSDGFDFQLQNGIYYFPMPQEMEKEERWFIALEEKGVDFGDLNGDGKKDAVAILNSWTGGTGQFYDLAVLLNNNGVPQYLSSIHLGDRIQVDALAIEKQKILLQITTHGPNDPLCCPTEKRELRYSLIGADLIEEKK